MRVAAERATISREVWGEKGGQGHTWSPSAPPTRSTLLILTSFRTCSSDDTGSFLLAPGWGGKEASGQEQTPKRHRSLPSTPRRTQFPLEEPPELFPVGRALLLGCSDCSHGLHWDGRREGLEEKERKKGWRRRRRNRRKDWRERTGRRDGGKRGTGVEGKEEETEKREIVMMGKKKGLE